MEKPSILPPFAYPLGLADMEEPPPLPNLTIQNSFSDESAYSSQVSSDVTPACEPVATEGEDREYHDSVIIVESSDADGDNDRESQEIPAQKADQLPANVAPVFRIRRRKKEDECAQPLPKKQKRGKNSAPDPEGLTVRKLTGSSKDAAGKAEDSADHLCNLEAVVTYSPAKKRKGSPVRSSSPKRSRSPSPDPAASYSIKQPVSERSKLLISHSSQGEHSDHKTASDPNDCAPFSQLGHVQQISESEKEWCKSFGTSGCVCKDAKSGSSTATISDYPTQGGDYRLPLLLEDTHRQLPGQVLLQLPKALEQLHALHRSHPSIGVHQLFTRCVASTGGVYAQKVELCDSAQPEPQDHQRSAVQEGHSVQHRKHKRRKQRRQQSAPVTECMELKCSINVQHIRMGDKKMLLARSINPITQISGGVNGGHTSVGAQTPVATSSTVVEDEVARDSAVVNLCSPEKGFDSCSVSSKACKQTTECSNVKETMQSFDHWNNALAPQKAADVLGNSSSVLAIMSWLQHWKRRMQPTATTGAVATVQAVGGKAGGSVTVNVLDTSDSDFESPKKQSSGSRAQKRQKIEDSDSEWMAEDGEEEEEDLCKVMLLLGPPGAGKTAAVYACAQELGYKVLEMNASSQRSRSQVMSHLMEASLSHQVKTTNTLSAYFSSSTQPKSHHPPGHKSKPAGRGIASFFKPVVPKGSADKEKPERGEGVVGKSQKDVVPVSAGCASVHLAKTGLILLEDVDVLFDEHDGGFWSSVCDVIDASRKPIIMTATDEALELGCDCLKVVFPAPSSNDLSAYLQVLGLSKGIQLSETECTAVADLQHRDIRRCILSAQLWFSSAANTHACDNESKAKTGPHAEEQPLSSSKVNTNPTVSWLLSNQLGVEVYSETGGSVCDPEGSGRPGLSVDAAHRAAQKHCAMQQQGIDIIYPLYEEQLRRMSESKAESKSVSSSLLPNEQNDGSQAAVAVTEQLKALLWCSSQMSSLDTISNAYSKRHSCPLNVAPWWSIREQDSLVDDHRDTAVDSQVLSEVSTLGDVLLLDLVKSRATLSSTAAQVDTLTELGSLRALTSSIALQHTLNKAKQQQLESWETCSPLFSRHHHVSRRVVSLDLLPWIRNMCTTECRRKEARLKRRYRHYFHNSPVKEDALNALPEKSGLSV